MRDTMVASVHNFILNYQELNLVKESLGDKINNTHDENSRNELKRLQEKLHHQQGQTYPAMEYPFWRKLCTTEKELLKHTIENRKIIT